MPTTTGLTIPFVGLRKQYHNLRNEILDTTDEVLRSGVLMNGNNTAEFEHWLASRNHSSYAVTCHSGTQALEIIARFCKEQCSIEPPTVLIPAMTYVATANAFVTAGWNVVFVDTDSHGLLDARKIPSQTSYQAVILVGLYGHALAHFGGIRTWEKWVHNDVMIVEDGAQHWLAADCQRIGMATAVSFDPMKNLACYGNGGAVITSMRSLAEYARGWRDNGKGTNHQSAASNSRMSELDCAQLLVKTKHIDQWQKRRATIAEYWMKRLHGSNARCLIDNNNFHEHGLHKFVIEIDQRDQVQHRMAERKIETKIHYIHPLHELDGVFRSFEGPGLLSAASSLSRRCLSLPIYPELTDLEVEYIIDQLLDLVA